jgi:hypothetical protein
MIPILDELAWQMTAGDRAALEGLLSQVQPRLAIEIGTAEGGSLRRIAAHSSQVLSFDLVAPPIDRSELPNVVLHTGDSHALLPKTLAALARQGTNVDFVLVDGDHTPEGVEQDARDLLASEAIRSSVVVFHDVMNDAVRDGLGRINVASEPKVVYLDLDFLAGRINYGGDFHHQLWGGLGLMVVDDDAAHRQRRISSCTDAYGMFELVAPVRDALVAHEQAGGTLRPGAVREALAGALPAAGELGDLRAELAVAQRRFDEIRRSKSWRLTAPLRKARQMLRN